jgi:hypothetical protein
LNWPQILQKEIKSDKKKLDYKQRLGEQVSGL